jgi:hypothetical protein
MEKRDKLFAKFGEPTSLDELGHWVIECLEDYECTFYSQRKNKKSKPVVLGLVWKIEEQRSVSNSHNRPINGVTNWRAELDKPKGYPGFYGRVWVRYSSTLDGFGSDPFGNTFTHTGTGGFGAYDGIWKDVCSAHWKRHGHRKLSKLDYPETQCYSWDYRFFLSDFPKLQETIEQEKLLKQIGEDHSPIAHYFLWEDPVTVAADKAFIEETNKILQSTSKS